MNYARDALICDAAFFLIGLLLVGLCLGMGMLLAYALIACWVRAS